MIDSYRKIITRWRLSNFDLAIETGRYKRPKIERDIRYCLNCIEIEDEGHVLLKCPLYKQIRLNHPKIFNRTIPPTIKSLMNPTSRDILYETGNILFEIAKTRKIFIR